MDKYTVDLDQVLNDFEYSELTDQYSNASRYATGTTNASQNNVTKHSINNVFHSLNEYLNTTISVSGLNQIDNNVDVKNNHVEDVNVLSLRQNKFRDEEKSIKDCNVKTDDRLLDFTAQVKKGSEIEEVKFLEENGYNVDGCKSNTAQVKGVSDVNEHQVGFLDENEATIENRYKNNEKTEEICTENAVSDRNSDLKDESLDYINEENEETEQLCEISQEKVTCNEDAQNEVEVKENVGNEDVNEETLSKTEDLKTNSDGVSADVEFSKEKEQAIGFYDDLNLDDSEINRLLDELEEEGLESNGDEKSQTIANVASTNSVEDLEETKESHQEGEHHSKDIIVTSESSAAEEAVQQPSESRPEEITVENNNSKEVEGKDIETGAKNLLLLETEELNSKEEESITVIETVSSDIEPKLQNESKVNEEKLETIGMKLNEEKTEEVVEEIKVDNETATMVIEKENSQDSLSRPQNLPLKGDGDEPKRKIDLIGDPGSTPYNNVYINKEIPKSKQKYDSDTDYSTSSSPTFSDVSSTASTVSVDEIRNDSGNNPQNVPNADGEKVVPLETAMLHIENPTPVLENPAVANADPVFEVSNSTSEISNPASELSIPTSEISNPTPEIKNPTDRKPEQSLASCTGDEDVLENSRNVNISEDDITVEASGDQMGVGAAHLDDNIGDVNESAIAVGKQWLGKEAPLWIPDSDATSCLHCDMKFTVLKRRHHCRACGLVLCSKCCHLRFRLQYLEAEARVCNKCHDILNKDTNSSSGSDMSPDVGNSPSYRPHPNNPLEYCSTVSPLQQVAGSNPDPPAVMVPVGVLKRKGSNKGKSNKSVMFCDGIRPGSDLTNLDNDFDYNNTKTRKAEKTNATPVKANKNLPTVDPETNTFIPSSENLLPPTVSTSKTDISYMECSNNPDTVELVKNEQLTFAIHISLNVHLKIINMSCCINKMAWCFSTEGLINVGQDEIVILLEYIDEESFVPKDVFYHINNVYNDAVKGTSVKEMGLSLHNTSNFLDSKNHAGFVYIRPTFQCLENVIKPKEPYLIGILIHRWETPWAKLFPLRLILRLGAEYRYYPSPIISTRHRESVFVEIGHTIINLLADFRNFSYTLPQIRGLTIHMEDKNTTITIPVNRYDQVMKSMNNSSDHILAFAGNFSLQADSHLVCIQDTQGNENCYSTHAINIHNKPRKVTGASFIVFNGALKSSSGLTAKSNIVEDGLMIQVLSEHMQLIRENLRAMKNHTIPCGCVNAASDETVNIVWGENDVNFNIGVVSAIDNTPLNGIPSIRVHNGKNHVCANGSRIIRWTEVFIIQSGDDNPKNQDPIDISRVSEGIAKATCDALVKYLDLLVANNCQKIGIRTTLHVENVSYSAGSNGTKLPPIYMKSLDNELIPVLHRITTNNLGENAVILELIFRILNV